jgi:signal transduction histidine kinase
VAGPFSTAPDVLNLDPWQGHTNVEPVKPMIVQASCVQVAVSAVNASAPVWATRKRPLELWTSAALPTAESGEPAATLTFTPPLPAVPLTVGSVGTLLGRLPLPPPAPPHAWRSEPIDPPSAATEASRQAWVQNSRRVWSVMAAAFCKVRTAAPRARLPQADGEVVPGRARRAYGSRNPVLLSDRKAFVKKVKTRAKAGERKERRASLATPMFEDSRAPRIPFVAALAALLVVLTLLAVLQFRWVGQVSEAERARLQAGARTRVEQLAQDFDREITRVFASLRVDAAMLDGPDGGTEYAARFERWAARTEHPGLVSAVYVLDGLPGATPKLLRFDPAERRFVDAPWPDDLAGVRQRLEEPEGAPGRPERGPGFRGPFGFVDDDAPALIVPIFAPEEHRGEPDPRFGRPRRGAAIVVLDRGYIQRDLLPSLAGRYFASGGEFDYCVVVTSRRDARALVYRSDPDDGAHPTPDASAGLLEVRFDQLDNEMARAGDGGFAARRSGRDPRRGTFGTPHTDHGVWEVGVTHRAGSLEQVVARTRHRNLLISFGTLLLLGASAAMVGLSGQRARRLAAQQVEFVAGVSHELRTPVAVVCSAGENLADGLVRDEAEVRVYGATIRDEGRRLAEMIEQVLEFAGITARERRPAREAISVLSLVEQAVKSCAGTIAEASLDVAVDVPPALPPVLGDRAALRRALQNLIQNSARHAAAGRWIGIEAAAGRAARTSVVRITVRDRGPGIPAGEEKRIFQAFYRGRQALAAGVSGSGLGLSLVQRIAEAHGGSVEVESTPGAGSAFTLVLPAAPAERADERTPGIEDEDAQANPAR